MSSCWWKKKKTWQKRPEWYLTAPSPNQWHIKLINKFFVNWREFSRGSLTTWEKNYRGEPRADWEAWLDDLCVHLGLWVWTVVMMPPGRVTCAFLPAHHSSRRGFSCGLCADYLEFFSLLGAVRQSTVTSWCYCCVCLEQLVMDVKALCVIVNAKEICSSAPL